MKMLHRLAALLCTVALGIAASPICSAQSQATASNTNSDAQETALSQRIEDLETQIIDLRSQLVSMKKSQAATQPAPTGPQGIAEVAATTMPPLPRAALTPQDAAPAPEKVSLAGLLGPTSVSGFVDVYYGVNFNHPDSSTTPYRAFDFRSDQFALNYAKLQVDKGVSDDSRLGYRVSLGFGDAPNTFNFVDSAGGSYFGQYLEEAYGSYLAPVGKGLQFDFGKFVTPHGAEVIESKDNWNYTRGILFSWAIPFYHFGARVHYSFNDKVGASFFAVNGWNNVVDNNTGKTYGGSLFLTPSSKFSLVTNFMAGPEQTADNDDWRKLSDTVITITPSDKVAFMFNIDYGKDTVAGGGPSVDWKGIAGYIKYSPSEKWALVGRYEYFDDTDGFATGTAQAMKEFTGTIQRSIGNFLTRFEYRHDYSNQPVFVKGGNAVFAQDTLTAGLIFVFDSHDAK